MRKRITNIILFLSAFSTVCAQQNSASKLVSSFDTYRKTTLHEKIFIHTDRTFYLIGETLWLKLYCRDASFLKPLDVSKVAYIEIIDADKKPVLQTKVALQNGNGNGSIFLPASLNSGHYTLRAYTNWMRNFDQAYYYEQALTLVNPFTKLGLKPINPTPTYDVQFFPEGGHLVNGLESTVGFRIADKAGKGVSFKGAIVDGNNDTITSFSPFKFGIGRFKFLPLKDHQYHAILTEATGKSTTYTLPPILEQGYTMHVEDTLADKIQVTLQANLLAPVADPTVHLVLHTLAKKIVTQTKFLQQGKAVFLLDKKDIQEGISHITIFDATLMPLCDRLYFTEQKERLTIAVALEQTKYVARKKVSLNITTSLPYNPAASTEMSIAVFKLDSLQGENQGDIASYLLLTSELKGTIESPKYYFEGYSTEKSIALDNLMLTHGWSRFRWDEILKNTKSIEFTPESNGPIINGKVTNTITGQPASRIATYLSSPGKIVRLYASRSNENGMVRYEMQDFYGANEIVVQTNTRVDSTYKVEILNPFSDKKTDFTLPAFNLSETLKNDLEQRSIHMQVQNIYYENENNRYVNKPIDSLAFYGKPDAKYELDAYTRFPTMEEVMREYVPGVLVRKRRDGFHLLNYDDANKTIFRDDALSLIDGVPVFDTDKIMAVDPRKIKTLDVMTRMYYLGPSTFPGINSYKTYKGNLAGFTPDSKSQIVNYQGVQLQHEFFSPRYDLQKTNANLPDTRNLLFWSPSITSNEQGKCSLDFYTSDITGKYQVIIQGITNDGKPGTGTITFEVKDKLNY